MSARRRKATASAREQLGPVPASVSNPVAHDLHDGSLVGVSFTTTSPELPGVTLEIFSQPARPDIGRKPETRVVARYQDGSIRRAKTPNGSLRIRRAVTLTREYLVPDLLAQAVEAGL